MEPAIDTGGGGAGIKKPPAGLASDPDPLSFSESISLAHSHPHFHRESTEFPHRDSLELPEGRTRAMLWPFASLKSCTEAETETDDGTVELRKYQCTTY